MPFGFDIIHLAFLGVGGLIGLLLGALLLRSACDLCSVDPSPGYLRCLLLTAILVAIGVPVGLGAAFVGSAVVAALRTSTDYAAVIAVLISLAVSAVVATAAFVVAFRVRLMKGAAIWLINTLLNGLVTAVLFMVVVGGWTIVDCAKRLF